MKAINAYHKNCFAQAIEICQQYQLADIFIFTHDHTGGNSGLDVIEKSLQIPLMSRFPFSC